jgi:putative ABC transport system substrate-binding protein
MRAATQSIPIVAIFTGDPVALGNSTSWSRPSGNVTGFLGGVEELSGKRIELLHELLPSARIFGLLYDAANRQHRVALERTEATARSLGLELQRYPVGDASEIEKIPARAVADHVAALIVTESPTINDHHAALIAAATALRLPTMHSYSFEAMDGGVIAYGTDQDWNWQRAAEYVHRLLHGARVSNLPFVENDHLVLTLNLKTAHAIGLEIPTSVVARADDIIE